MTTKHRKWKQKRSMLLSNSTWPPSFDTLPPLHHLLPLPCSLSPSPLASRSGRRRGKGVTTEGRKWKTTSPYPAAHLPLMTRSSQEGKPLHFFCPSHLAGGAGKEHGGSREGWRRGAGWFWWLYLFLCIMLLCAYHWVYICIQIEVTVCCMLQRIHMYRYVLSPCIWIHNGAFYTHKHIYTDIYSIFLLEVLISAPLLLPRVNFVHTD